MYFFRNRPPWRGKRYVYTVNAANIDTTPPPAVPRTAYSGTIRPAICSTCVPVTGRGASVGARAIGVREP